MRFKIEEFQGLLLPKNDNAACVQIRKTGRLNWDDQFNKLAAIAELKPKDVVFDVGAFIGDTTKTFCDRGCEVHAFEPRPENFICLLNNCPEAHCYNLALGDGSRFATDTRAGNMGGYPLLPGPRYSIRLDDLKVAQLQFLKIDVEGFELHVLRGAAETITTLRPTIHIEFNIRALSLFGHTPEKLADELKRLGYPTWKEVYRHANEHWDIVCKHQHKP